MQMWFDEDPDHYYLAECPRAYKRTGDTKIYDSKEIEIITDGIYRSLHYIVKYKGQYIEIRRSSELDKIQLPYFCIRTRYALVPSSNRFSPVKWNPCR